MGAKKRKKEDGAGGTNRKVNQMMVNLKSVLSVIALNIDGQILQLKMIVLLDKISNCVPLTLNIP